MDSTDVRRRSFGLDRSAIQSSFDPLQLQRRRSADEKPMEEAECNTNDSTTIPPPGMSRPPIKRRSAPNAELSSPSVKPLLRRSHTIDAKRTARQVKLSIRRGRESSRALQEAREKELRTATYQMLLQQFQLRKFTIQDFSLSDDPVHAQEQSSIRAVIAPAVSPDAPELYGPPVVSDSPIVAPVKLTRESSMGHGIGDRTATSPDNFENPSTPTAIRKQNSRSGPAQGVNPELIADANAETVASFDRVGSSVSSLQTNRRPSNSIHRTTSRSNLRKRPSKRQQTATKRFSLKRFLRLSRRRARKWLRRALKKTTKPFSPLGVMARIRHVLLATIFVIQLVYVPLLPAYLWPSTDLSKTATESARTMNIIIELAFIFDLFCSLNTSFYDSTTGELVTSRCAIFSSYSKRWLLPDMLSSIPIDLIQTVSGFSSNGEDVSVLVHSVFQFPRFLSIFKALSQTWNICRMLRIGRSLYAWLYYSRYSHLMRIVRMVLLVLLTAHYIGCGWHLVGRDNAHSPNAVPPGSSILDQYVADVYYAMLLIQGQGDPRDTTMEQNAYAIVAVLLGSLMVAIVFANITVLVSNFNANSTNYQRKMEVVHATMDKMQLPQELQDRIQRYYAHLWHQYDSLDGDIEKFLKELTPTLALEVGLFKHMALITKVPIWTSCSPDFMAHVVRNLVVQVYMPDDYVMRRGEVRRELFMINRGICERCSAATLFDRPLNDSPVVAEVASDKYESASGTSDTNSTKRSPVTPPRSPVASPSDQVGAMLLHEQQQQQQQWPKGFNSRRREIRKDKKRRRVSRTMYHASTTVSMSGSSSGEDLHDSDSSATSTTSGADIRDRRGSNSYSHTSNSGYVHGDRRVYSSIVQPDTSDPGSQRLSAGHAFGEMALLVNYEQPSSVQAVTYVEMCILHRTVFQQLLVEFPDDRREVLMNMLRLSVEKRELPLSWSEVCELVAIHRGVSSTSMDPKNLSTDEIVEALVEHIDHEEVDRSILFGFPDMAMRFPTGSAPTQRSGSSGHGSTASNMVDTRLAILRAFLPNRDDSLASHRSISSCTLGTDRTSASSRIPSSEEAHTSQSSPMDFVPPLRNRGSLARSNSSSAVLNSSRSTGRDTVDTLCEQMSQLAAQLKRLAGTQERLMAIIDSSVGSSFHSHRDGLQVNSSVRKARSASTLPAEIAATVAAALALDLPMPRRGSTGFSSLRSEGSYRHSSQHSSSSSNPVRRLPQLRRSASVSVPSASTRKLHNLAVASHSPAEAVSQRMPAHEASPVHPSPSPIVPRMTTTAVAERSVRSGRLLLSRRSMVENLAVLSESDMTLVDRLWNSTPVARETRPERALLPRLAEEERQRQYRDSFR